MCAIKNGDEIRRDFPSQFCDLVIYFLEKMSRFGSIRALVVPLLVVNRTLYPGRTSLGALLRPCTELGKPRSAPNHNPFEYRQEGYEG